MNLQKLKELIAVLEVLPISESEKTQSILEFLYKESKSSLREMLLSIDEMERVKREKERNILYQGLQDAMHGMIALSEGIENRKGKRVNDFYFHDSSISFLIQIMKAYFPTGKADGASQHGHLFFNKFVSLLKETKAEYLPDGKSYNWAVRNDYLEYINLVLSFEQ